LRLGTIQQVLRELVRERIPLKQLPHILEALCDHAAETTDIAELTNRVRRHLARTISHTFREPNGRMRVVRLAPSLEQSLIEAVEAVPQSGLAGEVRGLVRNICREIERQTAFLKSAGMPRILVVSASLRRHFFEWSRGPLPELVVLCEHEITHDTQLIQVATVGNLAVAA
ncbi:MAG TPA: FHIPEP family type III secretion protein, partial [Pirellulaceae bacterium]